VPVACPMAWSETVSSGHSRTTQMSTELQVLWSAEHDKPVPKLIVRAVPRAPLSSSQPMRPGRFLRKPRLRSASSTLDQAATHQGLAPIERDGSKTATPARAESLPRRPCPLTAEAAD
jgi:hypothetical protein